MSQGNPGPWVSATPIRILDGSSLSSPPTVQMCHLSDPTGFLLRGTRQDGLQRPRTPEGAGHRPEASHGKPATESQRSSSGYGALCGPGDPDEISVVRAV